MPRSFRHARQIKRWKRKHRAECTKQERVRRTVKRLEKIGVEISRKALR